MSCSARCAAQLRRGVCGGGGLQEAPALEAIQGFLELTKLCEPKVKPSRDAICDRRAQWGPKRTTITAICFQYSPHCRPFPRLRHNLLIAIVKAQRAPTPVHHRHHHLGPIAWEAFWVFKVFAALALPRRLNATCVTVTTVRQGVKGGGYLEYCIAKRTRPVNENEAFVSANKRKHEPVQTLSHTSSFLTTLWIEWVQTPVKFKVPSHEVFWVLMIKPALFSAPKKLNLMVWGKGFVHSTSKLCIAYLELII